MMRIAWFVFALLTSQLLLAQTPGNRTFQASAIAGFNLSQIDGDKLSGFHQPGINIGAKVDFSLAERWRLGLEMLYSQQGARRVFNDDPSATLDKLRLNFVELPLMIHFRDWKLQAGAGIIYHRLISFSATDVIGDDITELQNFRPDLFSMVFGCTFDLKKRMGLNVQWSKYLTDLQADPNAASYIGRTISLRWLYRL
jgi:hypothetical protein